MSPVTVTSKGGPGIASISKAAADGLRAAIDEATAAGATQAKDVVIKSQRVKTGRMRDANRARPAKRTGTIVSGEFYNNAPYAIYHEMGTIHISPIRFMELGKMKALEVLRKRLAVLFGGAR